MSLLEKILGPKSKYDTTLPYTYEARIPVFEGSEDYNSYFADTVCGLVDYLQQNNITPDEVQVFEIFEDKESPIDPELLTTADHLWRTKPEMCRAFEQHYKGHINGNSCTFNDRDCKGSGPAS